MTLQSRLVAAEAKATKREPIIAQLKEKLREARESHGMRQMSG